MANKPPQFVCTRHPAPPSLLSPCGIMARSACAALHTRNVPVAEYEAQHACLSRCIRMPSRKNISSSPHSPFLVACFATKEQPYAAGRHRAALITGRKLLDCRAYHPDPAGLDLWAPLARSDFPALSVTSYCP